MKKYLFFASLTLPRMMLIASGSVAIVLGLIAYRQARSAVPLLIGTRVEARELSKEQRAALDATLDRPLRELRRFAWSHQGALRSREECRPFIECMKSLQLSEVALDVDDACAAAFDRLQFSMAVMSGEQLAHGLDDSASEGLVSQGARWASHRDDLVKIEAAAALVFTQERSPASLSKPVVEALQTLMRNESIRAEVANRRAAILKKASE
ncbi:MAG: hypothetical protein U0638_07995 [Phycisphaerales bacterium]